MKDLAIARSLMLARLKAYEDEERTLQMFMTNIMPIITYPSRIGVEERSVCFAGRDYRFLFLLLSIPIDSVGE